MPSSISKARLRKAFDEGRRAATEPTAENPYDNPKLRQLWDAGLTKQRAGELTTPIPPLVHGETRARRVVQEPPGSKKPPVRAPIQRNRPRYGDNRFGDSRGPRGPRSR